MKINVGLIGRGKWGLKLKSKLIKNSNLKFVCGKKTNYSILADGACVRMNKLFISL